MWDDLSMTQRAELIKIGVAHGLRDIDSIKNYYNSFDDGGPKGQNYF